MPHDTVIHPSDDLIRPTIEAPGFVERPWLARLIDESLPVPGRPPQPGGSGSVFAGLRTVDRLRRLANTFTGAHDNLAKAVFAPHVVRLPAGYDTTQFDMTDAQRDARVDAGRDAMRAFLAHQSVLESRGSDARDDFSASEAVRSVANETAFTILQRWSPA